MHKTIAITLTALGLWACDRGEQSPMRRGDEAPGQPRGATPTPQPTVEERRGARELSAADRTFVREAASSGLFEVESSKAALERNDIGSMKPFAEKMLTDHAKTNEELKTLAETNGWELPERMTEKHQQRLKEIEEVASAALPKTYHRIQREAHEEAVKLFERCANNCDHADLRSFAAKNVRVLRMHLDALKKTSPTASLGRSPTHAGM